MLLLLPAGRRAGVQAQPAGLTHAIRPHVPGRRQRQRMPQPRLVLGWTGTDSRQGARQRQRMPQSRLVPRPRHGMARGMHRHHDLFNAVRTTRTCGRMGMPRTRHGMGGEGWQDPGPAHSGRPGRSGRNPQAGRQARRIQAGRAGAEGTRRQAGRPGVGSGMSAHARTAYFPTRGRLDVCQSLDILPWSIMVHGLQEARRSGGMRPAGM